MTLKSKLMISGALCGVLLAGQASALTFTDDYAVRYGDFLAWDLPILGISVKSTPGEIDKYVKLYTGSNGHYDNFTALGSSGGDDAYAAPNHTPNYFSTSLKPDFPDPTGTTFTGDTANTWDVRLSALSSFLNGSDAIFYFNNNQTGNTLNEISLWAWGQIKIVDDENVLPTLTYDFRNYFDNGGTTVNDVLGGQTKLDPSLYTSNGTSTGVQQANAFTLPTSGNVDGNPYYAFIPGEVCQNAAGFLVLCTDSTAVGNPVKLNLGANDAAYAMTAPEINALLHTTSFGGYDVMQVEFRMAGLTNGFEQLFIKGGDTYSTTVPEPTTMLLFGTGLAGLVAVRRRKKAC